MVAVASSAAVSAVRPVAVSWSVNSVIRVCCRLRGCRSPSVRSDVRPFVLPRTVRPVRVPGLGHVGSGNIHRTGSPDGCRDDGYNA